MLVTVVSAQAEWKANRWQQWVDYTVEVTIDAKNKILTGTEKLVYTNNSPDTLRTVYFHLYLNAFQPGSYTDLRLRQFGFFDTKDLPLKEQGAESLSYFAVSGVETPFTMDNTIMKADLPQPLLPGKSVTFDIRFKDKIPPDGDRMGFRGKHIDMGQWYPRMAVYDHKGWHADQHMGHEFYADYGRFNVSVTLPKEYILGHTGKLMNEEELFPGGLPVPGGDTVLVDILKIYKERQKKEKADTLAGDSTAQGTESLKKMAGGRPNRKQNDEDGNSLSRREMRRGGSGGDNRRSRERGEARDSSSGKDSVEVRTWKMFADTVFDFAFAADPGYLWDRAQWNGIIINSLYTPDRKRFWADSGAVYTRFIIKFYSETFGMWPYPQFTSCVGDVGGGIEYPQMTIITRRSGRDFSHGLFSILAHEIGHNWFYGLIGNNETYEAFLDEGFTSFATCLVMEDRYGRYENANAWGKWYQKKFFYNDDERQGEQRSYIRFSKTGAEEPIDTHSDQFLGGGAYNIAVYQKTASMLFMLQYTLGDSVFDRAMKEYYRQWHFHHPYRDDFVSSMEKSSGRHLEWFFRQWLDRTFTVDYALDKVKSKKNGKSYTAEVKVKRKGRAIMPLDLDLRLENGQVVNQKIPVDFWQNSEAERTFSYEVLAKVRSAELNPDSRIADVNRLNNTYPVPRVRTNFDPPRMFFPSTPTRNPIDAYQIVWRPNIWYNRVDFLKLGLNFSGSYIGVDHNTNFELWGGTKSGNFDFDLRYNSRLYAFGPRWNWNFSAYNVEGRQGGNVGLTKQLGQTRFFGGGAPKQVSAGFSFSRLSKGEYLPAFSQYGLGRVANLYFNLSTSWTKGKISSQFDGGLTTSLPRSRFAYSKLWLELNNTLDLIKKFPTSFRIFAGTSDGLVPLQNRYYLATASPSEIFASRWYRSKETLPEEWKNSGHLYPPGGGDLHGYLFANRDARHIAALNARVGFDNPLTWSLDKLKIGLGEVSKNLNAITTEAFLDFGQGWNSTKTPPSADFLADFGLAASYRIPYQWLRNGLGNESIRFYVPLYLSDPPSGERPWKFRWLFAYSVKF